MEHMEEGRTKETTGRQTPYRVGEIARKLGVSPKTIYAEIAEGALVALLIGGTYRVEHDEFEAYKALCRARALRVPTPTEAA
ncbi:helix-turn-helix domain-containing protein [Streptomyces aculeolatus]|uniref:helix-turn-helix domain-containing protein n=1 Tax=Streptomyces aculeolatus TaxID=270689 RepID=UPI001CEC25EE|nr:helix-turn-helix domain-containing protein [Streptomyces aculeolatus]